MSDNIMLHGAPIKWTVYRLGQLVNERREKVSDAEFAPLSVTRAGIVPQLEHVAKTDDGENRKRVKRGDFVINSRSDRKGSSGLSESDGSVSLINIVLEPRREVDGRFLHHLLRSSAFQEEFYRFGHGIVADLWTTRFSELKAIRVAIPDLKAQRSVADFLDRETRRIDALIATKERLVGLLEEKWYAELDSAILSCESTVGFIWTPLKHLINPSRPITYGIVLPGPSVEDGVTILHGGDVKPGRLDPSRLSKTTFENDRAYARSRVRTGDLVLAIRGSFGDCEIVPASIDGANISRDVARISPKEGVDGVWMRYALLAPSVITPLTSGVVGAAVTGFNIYKLKRLLIPTPNAESRSQIAHHLAVTESKLALLRSRIEQHRVRIMELRSTLITAAVTGQIDPAAWGRRGGTERALEAFEEVGERAGVAS
jgi:type I restriction enzyme, S subunit